MILVKFYILYRKNVLLNMCMFYMYIIMYVVIDVRVNL